MMDFISQQISSLISFLQSDNSIPYRWQTLIGALLGPFLAFGAGEVYQYRKAGNEAIRRVEASITQSLNDSFSTRKSLRAFKERIRELILEIRQEQNPNAWHFQEENFPPVTELASDAGLSGLRLSKSLYLHNKLLWIATGIKNTNYWLQEMKLAYRRLYEKNFLLKELGATPVQQREAYASNLENFLEVVDNLISFTDKGIDVMTQTKVYNQKLVGLRSHFMVWWYEGRSFKYFRTSLEFKNYAIPLNITDRVDKTIKREVRELISEAERRERMFDEQNRTAV